MFLRFVSVPYSRQVVEECIGKVSHSMGVSRSSHYFLSFYSMVVMKVEIRHLYSWSKQL